MAVVPMPAEDEQVAGPTRRARPTWERPYAWLLLGVDVVAVGAGLLLVIAFGVRSITGPVLTTAVFDGGETFQRSLVDLALVLGWPLALALSRAYEPRVLGLGSDEYRFVGVAALRLVAFAALTAFVFSAPLLPSYVLTVVATALVLSLIGRYVARKQLHRRRSLGRYRRRVLAIGSAAHVARLAGHLEQVPFVGYEIVAALCPIAGHPRDSAGTASAITDSLAGTNSTTNVPGTSIEIVGQPDEALRLVDTVGADTIALADSDTIEPAALRHLAWGLEGTGIDLLVAPALTEVAGPRISVRPVGGLPLMHVEEPQLSGGARFAKGVFDRVGALLLLVMLSPVLLACALAVRLRSGGPVFFTQPRVGRDGHEFRVVKFRTMVVGAEAGLADLRHLNDHDGVLFKIRDDPRVTAIGAALRRRSLDELPQLFNVLAGSMSLVGPRPPLPSEVSRYGEDARRRLLVKPGITGLWQVSGRADLSWEESVRVDLDYVENWSPALDLQILWRTIPAVLRGEGAY